jgi:hypothetical protein
MRVHGSLFVFQLFDVAEAIRTDELSKLLGAAEAAQERAARKPAQTQPWFEPPPAVQALGEVEFAANQPFQVEMHYYSYGVVSLRLERAFDLEWQELIELCERWIAAPEAEAAAVELVRQQLARVSSVLVKPYPLHLSEDYTVARLDPLMDGTSHVLTAEELLAQHGGKVAQIVRGDANPLAAEEQAHILASRMSYYPTDLIVAGWSAACVYDSSAGAETTIRLIEYANTQLLEFRFYDELLTRTLSEVYRLLNEGTNFWRRWRLAKEAERLNTVRLDVHELAERSENAAKFLSDMFAARLYRLVAERVGVQDYRRIVDNKLQTAGELYRFMTERLHQSSALTLETMVVIILIIDLVFLFRGKG